MPVVRKKNKEHGEDSFHFDQNNVPSVKRQIIAKKKKSVLGGTVDVVCGALKRRFAFPHEPQLPVQSLPLPWWRLVALHLDC